MGRRRHARHARTRGGIANADSSRAEPEVSDLDRRPHIALWIVAAWTMLAGTFHVLSQAQRHLWADEASTYWTTQARAWDLLRGARLDGTPPFHFLIVSAFTRLLGSSEFVLRLPSILAATALVPASYAVMRLFATRRTALIAAALAAISPLVHFYAVEARAYALLQLETLAILYCAYRAMSAPQQRRWWVGLCIAQTVQLWTHNYALFLLPVPALVALLIAAPRRLTVAARAAAAALIAFATYVPWFLRARASEAAGVGDWIRPFWEATPPSAAIVRSLEVFGFGGRYPDYLTYLRTAPSVRVLAWPLIAGLLVFALLGRRRSENSRPQLTLFGFLFVPLVGAWLYSWFGEPLYFVGRYDTIVLPVCLMLFAMGLDAVMRRRAWIGWTLAAAIVVLAVVSSWPALGPPLNSDEADVMAAQYLLEQSAPGDPIVFTGTRRPVVAYYFDRARRDARLVSFPAEIAEHPGWFSEARMRTDPTRLAHEGEALTDTLAAAAEHGHTVWLASSGPSELDSNLYDPLLRRLVVDRSRSVLNLHLYGLKARNPEG